MQDVLGVRGRVALITGAASGYGRATAEVFAEQGVRLALCDINQPMLAEVAAKLEPVDGHLLSNVDISHIHECENLVRSTIEKFGRLDILVNVAAVLEPARIDEVDEEHWERTLDVNLKGAYFLTRAASRPMRRAKWGRVINFVSTAGVTGGKLPVSVYGISKGGLITMTKGFARAFGRDNVLVNAISPATLRSPLWRCGRSERELTVASDGYLQNSLYGRWTEPWEVARSVLYLASEMSNCVSGHLLHADSGAEIAILR